MLTGLKVRDLVLIESLDLTFTNGLSVLTGETGAGKTIVLEALGVALGGKGDKSLVRPGARQASVTAVFEIERDHRALALAAENGLDIEPPLILRRAIGADGRSRAFVNDEAVTLSFLRALGDSLVEVLGQHDDRGLLDLATHRAMLDSFAGLEAEVGAVAEAHARFRGAEDALADADARVRAARERIDFLSFAENEITRLDPKVGEEDALASERALMGNSGKIAEAVQEALDLMSSDGGLDSRLAQAYRKLARVAERAGAMLQPPLAALDRAVVEFAEARAALESAARALTFEPQRLEEIEERLFALRALARKHNVRCDELPALGQSLREELARIETADAARTRLCKERDAARADYLAAAQRLSRARKSAAEKLDKAVAREFKPLKLDKAQFRTEVETLDAENGGAHGLDRVRFLVSTNPGAAPGPLAKIASGGELSRFMLALKVVLARDGSDVSLVFDEVDRGVGGAVAAAVGERLSALARHTQILAVTHSPQVAARAQHHFQVAKRMEGKGVTVDVRALSAAGKREEIARMLAGASITDEARAAAGRLLMEPHPKRARS